MIAAHYRDAGFGVYRLDTAYHRAQLACCYLIDGGGEWAIVDSGTARSAPQLLNWIDAIGAARERVRWIIPTHVHLDHAGGVGVLAAALPKAQVAVHPRGARHLIDPSQLIAGTKAVYGEDGFNADHAGMCAVDADRVVEAGEGLSLRFGDRQFEVIDSPGHARHHLSLWDERSQGWFTGDSFGLSYREFDNANGAWLMPTTTPVQFEPEAWVATIERYLRRQPQRMWLTHFDVVEDVSRLAALLLDGIAQYRDRAMALVDAAGRPQALLAMVREHALQSLHAHGCTLDSSAIEALLHEDWALNAQGLEVWLQRQSR